jgi:hypothetical protein
MSAPFDDVRLALLDELLVAKQSGSMVHESWQQAFDHAARSLRMRVIEKAERELRETAAFVRYPGRRLASLLPNAEAADAFLNRLLAEGMPLERFEGLPDTDATRRSRALAIEAAWEGAAKVAGSEAARWRGRVAQVAAWQRSRRPLWIVTGVVLSTTILLAAWLGGELPAPEWFSPIARFWWSLPWP